MNEINSTYQRNFKDRLFIAIFGRDTEQSKQWRLDLYNALNNTNYTDPNALELNTIENVIYITMHNDVSFLVDSQMNLYEQQSTYNPNMPLRGFMYFSQLYQKHLTKQRKNILSSTLIKIPTPKFIVFYNGKTKMPDISKLYLSDAFITKDEHHEFEWTATVYNISSDSNLALQKKCKPLYDYIQYTQRIRDNLNKGLNKTQAIEEAVDWAEKENLLNGFFKNQKAEVIGMSLTEFDEEDTYRTWREDGIEIGKIEGRQEKAVESAITMLKKHYPISDISEITSLSKEKILELQEQITVKAEQ